MSKLPKENQFLDLSDYGRGAARWIANSLKSSTVTPIQVTIAFIISGLLAIFAMLNSYFWLAAFFLIFKSILDAADGELARIKNTPSYTGRYFDSVADIILNLLFILTIRYLTDASYYFAFLAFIGIQLQGTLYNYYYVILRNKHDGDTTSRIFEDTTPTALSGEKQRHVDILFAMYNFCYRFFDKIIYHLDKTAIHAQIFPKWFMTIVSTFGLGFQLLLISIFLVLGWVNYIIPFFMLYSVLIVVFIGTRKFINQIALRKSL
ncbi:MAG: CDP-alcohol phosphatidyltransferase family protein [Saprospiraceae bacterium]